jgi:hypothetical protein
MKEATLRSKGIEPTNINTCIKGSIIIENFLTKQRHIYYGYFVILKDGRIFQHSIYHVRFQLITSDLNSEKYTIKGDFIHYSLLPKN